MTSPAQRHMMRVSAAMTAQREAAPLRHATVYSMSFLSGLAVLLVLITLKKVERRFIDDRTISKIEIEYDAEINNGMYYSNTNEIFKEFSIRVRSMKKDPNENRILYTLVIPRQYSILDLTSEFSKNKEVTSIKIIK